MLACGHQRNPLDSSEGQIYRLTQMAQLLLSSSLQQIAIKAILDFINHLNIIYARLVCPETLYPRDLAHDSAPIDT